MKLDEWINKFRPRNFAEKCNTYTLQFSNRISSANWLCTLLLFKNFNKSKTLILYVINLCSMEISNIHLSL